MVKVALPNASSHFDNLNCVALVYTLIDPIEIKILHCNKFVNNFDVDTFLGDNSNLSYECTISPVVDKDHQNILTDSFQIIFINNFCKLFLEWFRVPRR